jgi:hypothetical protein
MPTVGRAGNSLLEDDIGFLRLAAAPRTASCYQIDAIIRESRS